jgi:hypothetical protein
MSTTEILDAALALSSRKKAELVSALIESLDAEREPPFQNADENELLRRLSRAHDNPRGRSSAVVARSVLERLHKRKK